MATSSSSSPPLTVAPQGHSTAFAIEQGQGSVHLRLPPETWVDSPSEQTGQVFRELLGGG